MRAKITAPCVLMVLFLIQSAHADVLKLSNGGELTGTLEQVTMLVNGKETTQARAAIDSLALPDNGRDILVLKDGTKIEGEFVSLKFATIGGSLTFLRKDIAGLSFAADALAAARKELAEKKAKVEDTDAAGLLELAKWCREKGLKTESLQLAQACLKANPTAECAAEAQKLLGTAEKPPEPVVTPADPPAAEKKLTPEEVEALKKTSARNDELLKTYLEKAAGIKTDELAKAKDKYEKDWADVAKKIKDLEVQIEKKQAARDATAQIARTDPRYKTRTDDKLVEDQAQLKKTKVEQARLIAAMRTAKSAVATRDAKRIDQVKLTNSKVTRILRTGKNLEDDKLVAAYEASLKID